MKNVNQTTRMLCEGAVSIALAYALTFVELDLWFQGGSISAAMIPIILFAVRWGAGWGIVAGLAFGTLKYFLGLDSFVISWVSIVFDYTGAYAMVGLAGLFKRKANLIPLAAALGAWIATAIEVDRALELLLQKLEAAGKLDKTLIVATGDHIPYFDVSTLEELSGKKFGSSEAMERLDESSIDFDVYKSALILWSASMTEPVVVDKPCCQVDILPTVSNLLGLEYDSRMLAGSDILSDSEGLVVFTSTCWMSDRGFYNRFTQTFTPAEGVTMTAEEQENYVSAMKKLVNYKLKSTPMIVENNFYQAAFGR